MDHPSSATKSHKDTTMNNDEKFQLITENLQEVIRPQVIHDVLAEGRPLKIYWGMSQRSLPKSSCPNLKT